MRSSIIPQSIKELSAISKQQASTTALSTHKNSSISSTTNWAVPFLSEEAFSNSTAFVSQNNSEVPDEKICDEIKRL